MLLTYCKFQPKTELHCKSKLTLSILLKHILRQYCSKLCSASSKATELTKSICLFATYLLSKANSHSETEFNAEILWASEISI